MSNDVQETNELRAEIERLKREIGTLKQRQIHYSQTSTEVDDQKHGVHGLAELEQHSDEFWRDIDTQCKLDPESVKEMVTAQKISMSDADKNGQTLLLLAARHGAYDIVQLCLNLGADLEHTDNKGLRALEWARKGAWYHVEQLLLFAGMNGSVGDALRHTADTMTRQKGLTEIWVRELESQYKDQHVQQLIRDALTTIMHQILEKKLAFSDDLLHLCLHFECAENAENILETNLWKTIAATCEDVVENGSQKDWFWFKEFLLKSTIWCQSTSVEQTTANDEKEDDQSTSGNSMNARGYLYYKLLNMIDSQSNRQLEKLQADIASLAQTQETAWQNLKSWQMAVAVDEHAHHPVPTVRQDSIPNGLRPKYTHKQLSEQGSSSSSFNAHSFFDHHQYLSQLLLLAHQADEEFHKSAQAIFGIRKRTKTTRLTSTNGDGVVRYQRGPVKLLERAKAKAGNDYFKEAFPTSACVLDLNRCAFVFNDVETLFDALNFFVNKIKCQESGNIVGIVRCKNTFKLFSKSPNYADVKLNVLIRGKSHSLIGEVQFLLQAMKTFKDCAHNLYSIQRRKEYFDNSVTAILPVLLNDKGQLFVSGNMGDVKSLCKLMTHQNKSEDFLMQIDEESGESILANMCVFDAVRALQFLSSVISEPLFVDRMLARNRYNDDPFSYVVRRLPHSSGQLINFLFSIESFRQRCLENLNTLYRILFYLFQKCDVPTIEYVTRDLLCLSKPELLSAIQHKYVEDKSLKFASAANQVKYTENIVSISCRNENSDVLQKLESLLGLEQFVELLFVNNAFNVNAIEKCASCNNLNAMKYLSSVQSVKAMYSYENQENHGRIFRLLYRVVCRNPSDEFMDLVLDALKLNSREILSHFAKHRCVEMPSQEEQQSFVAGKWRQYHNYLLLAETARAESVTVDRLKRLFALMDEKACVATLLESDGFNKNALEYAILANKVDTISFILEFDAIKEACVKNNDLLWRIAFWLCQQQVNLETAKTVSSILNVSQESLQGLQSHKMKKPENMTGLDAKAIKYWKKSISSAAVARLTI